MTTIDKVSYLNSKYQFELETFLSRKEKNKKRKNALKLNTPIQKKRKITDDLFSTTPVSQGNFMADFYKFQEETWENSNDNVSLQVIPVQSEC